MILGWAKKSLLKRDLKMSVLHQLSDSPILVLLLITLANVFDSVKIRYTNHFFASQLPFPNSKWVWHQGQSGDFFFNKLQFPSSMAWEFQPKPALHWDFIVVSQQRIFIPRTRNTWIHAQNLLIHFKLMFVINLPVDGEDIVES